MSGIVWLVGMVAFWLVAITAAYAWEKRLVWPYVPESLASPSQIPPPNSYANKAAAAAAAAGFGHWGTFADGKGKLYRVRYEFFRSPSGDALALVGTGTVAGMALQATWVYSLLEDGRCFITFDHQNGAEADLTGTTEDALIAGASFGNLLQTHRQRVAVASCGIELFGEVDPLVAFRQYKQRRLQLLIARGYAAYIDRENNAWRYTLKGAMIMSYNQYFTGLRRTVVSDKTQLAAKRRL
ncbi:MAG: hypothetical protein V4671_26745 [Armatimonadota bacterium]